MRNRVVSVLLSAVSLLAMFAGSAAAQQPTSSQEYDLNAAVLYDVALNERNAASNVGVHVDVAKRFLQGNSMNVAGVGEAGFNHFENETLSTYLGGIRFAGNYSTKFSPFAQFLVGVERCCSTSNFAIQPGLGVDVPWKPKFAVRAQVDWRHVYSDLDDADGLRVAVGIVFPLSR